MRRSSNGKPRSRQPYMNGKCAPFQPGDELLGGWSREQLIRMDARFCAAVERSFARGLERRPPADQEAA